MAIRIRGRLTLWNTGVLCLLLLAFSGGVLAVQRRLSRGQFDQELRGVSATMRSVMDEELGESHTLARAAAETRKSVNIPARATAILDANGKPITAHWRGLHAAVLPKIQGPDWLGTVSDGPQAWRVYIRRIQAPDADYTIVSAGALDELAHGQKLLARILLVATPLAILFAAVISWWAASRALRPLTDMAAEAEAITVRGSHFQLSAAAIDDEIGQLTRAFNRLLHRMAVALQTQRDFMADASHELRTPTSIARTAAEVTLGQPRREEAEYRDALGIVAHQTGRLGRMIEDMLVLARADAGGYRIQRADVDLDELVAECVASLGIIASQHGIEIEADVAIDGWVIADDALLRRMLTNLLDNAIKHTPAGRSIRLKVNAEGGTAVVTVEDAGCGIPDADRERVFERFVRLDPARASSAGAGLGLPIARWIAEAHGGTLSVSGNELGGCTFTARLPILSAAKIREPRAHPAHAV